MLGAFIETPDLKNYTYGRPYVNTDPGSAPFPAGLRPEAARPIAQSCRRLAAHIIRPRTTRHGIRRNRLEFCNGPTAIHSLVRWRDTSRREAERAVMQAGGSDGRCPQTDQGRVATHPKLSSI